MFSVKNSRKILVLGLVIASAILFTSDTQAFRTGPKWQNQNYMEFRVNPNLPSLLAMDPVGLNAFINAFTRKWYDSSRFSPIRNDSPGIPNFVTAQNFITQTPPDCDFIGNPNNYVAIVCVDPRGDPINVTRTRMYFNISGTYQFTFAEYNYSTRPIQIDFGSVFIHELGHFFVLEDLYGDTECAGDPVMCPRNIVESRITHQLQEDDKMGATQLYGPWTSWEPPEARGHLNRINANGAQRRNVNGYFGTNSPPPEASPRSYEFSVPVLNGGAEYEMMAGSNYGTYSFVYFELFSGLSDFNRGPHRNYVKIRPGMWIEWNQFNHQQSTIAIDFETLSGRTLRDSGAVDQNGNNIHPASRWGYPTRQWLWFRVNLPASLENEYIYKWFVAYDNGQTGTCTDPSGYCQFRAYFDNLQIRP